MQDLTPEGQALLQDVANRHAVSLDAVVTLLRALAAGGGAQAQFSHPDLGGMGQWSQGGMIMVGDMFNQGLKYRVDSLCNELSTLLRAQPMFRARPTSFQSQSQGNGGDVSLFVQGSGFPSAHWWPAELGDAASVGAQNDLRYAYFPGSRRLAIQQGGQVRVYDTGDHFIGGFSQQQSGDQSLTFTSQFGLVRVADLPCVYPGAASLHAAPEPPRNVPTPPPPAPAPAAPAPTQPVAPAAPAGGADIFATIERLAELRQKNIISEEEFAAKKSDLLSRL
jgi:hypothetical protein